MGMSYQSPLGKLPIKRKKNIKDPPIKIPDILRLPDGREFVLKDLMVKPKREFINLRTKTVGTRPNNVCKEPKYSYQDHVWISQADPVEVMNRFELRREYVKTFINRSRAIIKRIQDSTDDHIITVGKALTDT